MKKYLCLILTSLCLIPGIVKADEVKSTIRIGEASTGTTLQDKKEGTYKTIESGNEINITSEKEFSRIYIQYRMSYKPGTLTVKDKTYKVGENGFLHEYLEFEPTTEAKIVYDEKVIIEDIYTLDDGELPDYVEVWEKPCEKADLLLFSTHSDDEQLFFLGLLPKYVADGADVQVVYFAHHNDAPGRLHEQLHGLYTVGVRHYPVIGFVPDAFSKTLDGALANLKKAGYTEDDTIKFQVEIMRRFKPQVVVGHDEAGEYSHGQHILNTHSLEQAIELTNDPTYDQESIDKYGLFDVPKLYLHLYKQNEIIMDYDTPLDYFDGKTAYEVSKMGYAKHRSQQWTWFTGWINGKNNEIKKSTEIKTYSPNKFGLFRTTVGEDVEKNDMFENLTYYKKQKTEKPKKEETKEEVKTTKKVKKNSYKKDFIKEYKMYFIIAGGALLTVIALAIIIKAIKK